jgi:hypothetical protein
MVEVPFEAAVPTKTRPSTSGLVAEGAVLAEVCLKCVKDNFGLATSIAISDMFLSSCTDPSPSESNLCLFVPAFSSASDVYAAYHILLPPQRVTPQHVYRILAL